MVNNSKDYYVGLDLGTSSVGWAVTDTSYKILRAKGKDMWGARMFDEASTAAERRSSRISRRRREREKKRIAILQELFEEEIKKVDPGFFHRLEESKFWLEDRTGDNSNQKYAIFAKGTTGDKEYTDVDYYHQYPTIFHLRAELAHSSDEHDVRLVYLALLNMFKHRGHFLNESLSEDSESNFDDAWNTFVDSFSLLLSEKSEDDTFDNCFELVNISEFKDTILQKGVSKSQVRESLSKLLGITKKNKLEYSILSLLCGLTGNLEDIFGKEALSAVEEKSKKSLNFLKSTYEENITSLQDVLDEKQLSFIFAVKELHDVFLLDQIMKGYAFLCDARVDSYNQHKNDLALLKRVIKRVARDEYSNMFRKMKDGNYSAYVGSTNSDKTGGRVRRYVANHSTAVHNYEPDELYKYIKKILSPHKDDEEVAEILQRIEGEVFLRKQLTSANGVIPNQVYVREMKAILSNAEKYLPSLTMKDESGYTVSEKIIQLFQFHMPYYVGPVGGLNKGDKNKWAVRLNGEPIRPWNMSRVIDMEETRKAFIENLIRHCTYLNCEKVLPKHSLAYEKFMVLNELNNVKIAGEPLSVELKQDIYNELFMRGKQVTKKQFCQCLYVRGELEKGDEDLVSGIEDRFNSSLSSIGKFNEIFESPYLDLYHIQMIEEIILFGTIYGDSKKLLRDLIQKKYGKESNSKIKLSDKQIQRIIGFKFSDWGRCSRAFLELEGASKKDGVIRTLLDALWETNDNLMQLLSQDNYTYFEELNKNIAVQEKKLSDWSIDDLDNMYLSSPVKRMVWQTLNILLEIEGIMECPPKRVFVEMTRENRVKGVRTKSRKSQLIELYKNADLAEEQQQLLEELEGHTEADLRIRKLYLYYCQMGRCMYTNEPIVLEQLMDDSIYDIDHIYPRHFVKDDSLENNLVLVKKTENAHKSDTFPIEEKVRRRCYPLWEKLRKNNLISKEKFERLTRKTEFTLDERVAFVQRQLVETGQGTKAITQILQASLPESSDVVFSKAGIVSQFRHDFNIYKCRSVNDFHHAQDAYLNIVAGNVYYVKFTKNPRNFIKESMLNCGDDSYKYHLSKMYEHTVKRGDETAWISEKDGKNNTIVQVKKQIYKNTPLITRRSYVSNGAITNKETVYSRFDTEGAASDAYFPLKTADERLNDVTKYGGKKGLRTAAYSLISYKEGKKEVISIEAIPGYLMKTDGLDENDKKNLIAYYEKIIRNNTTKECKDFKLLYPVIKFNSLLKVDGYYYYIGGKTGNSYYLYNAVPLKLSPEDILYVKKIDKAINNGNYNEINSENECIITKEKNIDLYNRLLSKLTGGIFEKRKGSLLSSLKNGQDKFNSLDKDKQCIVIQNIVSSFSANTQTVDLSLIDEASHAGKIVLNKNMKNYSECVLVNQSITGLYTYEIKLK